MKSILMRSWRALAIAVCAAILASFSPAQDPDKRFPPLKVPEGFKATLFACDPLIEYPSVLALGPRPRTIFLAHDYMTGLGTEIIRRDEIRLVEDTDGDGRADKSTVYAGGFNSIQGLAYHEGTVYAMHAPFLTALRDTKGTGVADERRDLLTGLGWPPEKAPDRLHCANGVVVGHDGWLYLALGDRGCDVKRPEGDRLVLNGGGILRCRPDGTDLHVFATGLRNIYDVTLDADLNVFVRDNENDGGTYMIRVCHSFFGADHGYPYHYYERPDEALAPLADMGLGSSAGGVCYLERGFPPAYRGNLFFCEWGRSVVRYALQPAGSAFAPVKEVEFASGDAGDPYGFKPTDVIADRDGSLLVSDWADGQRPKRGRGRVYRVEYVGKERAATEATGIDSESYTARLEAQSEIMAGRATLQANKLGVLGRIHAVWIAARTAGRGAIETLMGIAAGDPEPRVRAQAIRAVADLADPILVNHRLDAGAGDADLAKRLAALARGQDPCVVLEIVVALGRLRWSDAPMWLRENVAKADAALSHAAMQTLRRSGNWPEVLKLLDEPEAAPIRPIALRAISEIVEPVVVDGLIQRLGTERDSRRRRELADTLTRVCRKRGPWVYWGFRPAPRPANTESWERTDAIEAALNEVLKDADRGLRTAILRRMQRENILARPETLAPIVRSDRDPGSVAAALDSLKQAPAEKVVDLAEEIVREKEYALPHRLMALDLFVRGLGASGEKRLLELAGALEDSPVEAEALKRLGQSPKLESRALLLGKLSSISTDVRVAAIEAIAELDLRDAAGALLKLLDDSETPVRRSAATALGRLRVKEAIEPLLRRTGDKDADLRRRSLRALGGLREPRAAAPALAALKDSEMELAALECLAEVGGPEHAGPITEVASKSRSSDVLQAATRALSKSPESVASLQGVTGVLLHWSELGPLTAEAAKEIVDRVGPPGADPGKVQILLGKGLDSRVDIPPPKKAQASVWIALSDFMVDEAAKVQFLASSGATLEVWLNGRSVYRRAASGPFAPDSDRFDADLQKGTNRLVVQISGAAPPPFHVRFRRKTGTADQERLAQLALSSKGDPERGRKIFFAPDKPGCVKCHRIGDQGGRVGPDLGGAGRRFPKIYIIESILEPSRSIATTYQNWAVKLKDGRIFSGVRVAETETTLTLGDIEGKDQPIRKSDIEEQKALALSLMPEGLEKALTDKEFVDLIAFLLSQK